MTASVEPRTTIVRGGDVVTMGPTRRVLRGGSVAFSGDVIVGVGSTSELAALFPDADVVDASGCIVTPGLVNAHQHFTGDPLVRCCIPDDVTSDVAIFEWAVPVHGAHTSIDDGVAAAVTAVEAVSNGVTTLVEAGTVGDADAVVAAMTDVGVRGTIGVWGWDVEDGPFAAPADEVLDRQRAIVEHYPAGGLVEGWVTLVGHDLASDELFAGAADLSRELGTGLSFHMSPSSSDAESYLQRTGKRPLVHLDDLGVLGRNVLVGHGVWLDDAEVDIVLDRDVAVASCPWAYLRLAQGITRAGRHAELIERGGRVALGCDAHNAGDAVDILRTAALLAGLAKDRAGDPTRLGADQAFALATIEGARAIGLADRIGSIEVGKQADLVVHRTDVPGGFPVGDLAHHLIWGTDGRTVRDVFVAGRRIVDDGHVITVDVVALRAEADVRRAALIERAGITPHHRWPDVDAG
ncbi:MAG: amidohydrolase family protein [Actinomycetota bacterium]